MKQSSVAQYASRCHGLGPQGALLLLLVAGAGVAGGTGVATAAAAPPTLAVLDVELTGDLGGPGYEAEHAARLRMASDLLRGELERSGLYTVVDLTPAHELIARLQSQQRYLHDCNGCDLDVGRQLGAQQVLVAWVDRVSGLILTLTYEIHDVASNRILLRKSFDFRGDNDAAWQHAVHYMVRDLKSMSVARPAE